MPNTQFSLSLHVLTLLASDPERWFTSREMAEMLGSHPVVIRRVTADLAEADFINSKRGAGGGVSLKKDPKTLTLGQLADVVEPDTGFDMLELAEQPEGAFLPQAIASAIEAQRKELRAAAVAHLDTITLSDVTQAATLRADLAGLVHQGLSDSEIREGYRIENGRLIPKT